MKRLGKSKISQLKYKLKRLTKGINGGLPRLTKFLAIFTIKIIMMFFIFQHFSNDARGVIWG
jgi:hypothetical protein